MFKLIFILLGAVGLIAGLGAGGVAAAYAAGVIKAPEVEEVRNSWGEVTLETTEVRTSIALNNPNSISVGLDNISVGANVYLNDIPVAQGETEGVSLPQGRSVTELVTRIDNAQIAVWWPTHISNGETTTIRIAPYGKTKLLGFGLDIPGPSLTETFQTDMLEGANTDQPEDVALAPGMTLTIQSREFEWGVATAEQTQILGTVTMRNNGPAPLPVTRIAFVFTMNGIVVGQGVTQNPAVLLPGQDTPVPVNLTITNTRLIDWWPTHITNGEHTQYRIDVSAVVNLPILGPVDLPLMAFQDEFQTSIMAD